MNYCKEYILKNGEKLIIRNAEIEEAAEVAVCSNKIHDETEFLSFSSAEHFITTEEEKQFIQTSNENPRASFLVAEYKNHVVGTIVLRERSRHQRLSHRAEIGLGVLQAFNRIGIAGKLMMSIIECAKKIGFEQIELNVAITNESAINLYKSFGFEFSGTIKNSFKFSDGRYFDAYIMQKFLRERR